MPPKAPIQEQAFAQADPEWLALTGAARQWLSGPLGQLLLAEERQALDEELQRYFGSFMVHYGPAAETPPAAPQIQSNVRLGAPLPGVHIVCEEQAWPLVEHAADVVLLQHGLDFCVSPHGLLREAARSVRPGGHLLIIGFNPVSLWNVRRLLTSDAQHQARFIGASRVVDWLNLLGFALEKRRFGCYRPPLASAAWQRRFGFLERFGQRWQPPGGGFYLLVARKLVVGLRPLPQPRREPLGKLVALPLAKINRRDAEP